MNIPSTSTARTVVLVYEILENRQGIKFSAMIKNTKMILNELFLQNRVSGYDTRQFRVTAVRFEH